MASERFASFFEAHAAIAAAVLAGTRAEMRGSWPVAGRPLDFLCTDIGFFIISVYTKSRPRGRVQSSAPTLTPAVKSVDQAERAISSFMESASKSVAMVSSPMNDAAQQALAI